MRVKFSSKVEYHVSDTKVVCIAKPESRVQSYLIYLNDTIMDKDKRESLWNEIVSSPTYFKGIARLKNGDTNDIQQAKTIARKKAMRQMYRYYTRIAAKIIKRRQYDNAQIAEAFASLAEKADQINKEIIEEVRK